MTEHQNWQSSQSIQVGTYKSQNNIHKDPSKQLDLEYLTIREQIVNTYHYLNISKHAKIRLNGWLQKLDKIIANQVWKRNRNTYAKLMNLMCDCEVIVEPFHSLPPQNDVPKLNKHEVNRIIDEIERQVKNGKNGAKGITKDTNEKSIRIRPQEYWHRIKNQKNKGNSNKTQADSIFLGKFASIEEKYKQSMNFSKTNEDYHSMTEENHSIKDSYSNKNAYFSDEKNKSSSKKTIQFDVKENILQAKPFGKPPKHLVVSLNPKTNMKYLEIQKPIIDIPRPLEQISSNYSDDKQSRLQAFRDGHISIEIENQTLKTQLFDQDLSIHPQLMQDFLQISFDDYDETDQLSQRWRIQEEESNISYFASKLKEKQLKCFSFLPN